MRGWERVDGGDGEGGGGDEGIMNQNQPLMWLMMDSNSAPMLNNRPRS